MRTNKKILVSGLLILLASISCEKEEVLPANQAKGTIIADFTGCYGYFLLIEVSAPKGIGLSGEYTFAGSGRKITFRNAIAVPYFYRISELNTTAPYSIGTWLYFEYRDVKSGEGNLFRWPKPIVCPDNIIPLKTKKYIITRIIEYH